jgi:hypothetical protein
MNAFCCEVCYVSKPNKTVSEIEGICSVCFERQSCKKKGLKPEEKVPDANEVAFSENTIEASPKVVDIKEIMEKYPTMCEDEEKQYGYTSDEEERRKNVYEFKEPRSEFEKYQKLIAKYINDEIDSDINS